MKKPSLTLLLFLSTFISTVNGADMQNALIVYGSFSGSTGEIADSIGRCLKTRSCDAEIIPAQGKAMDLSGYDLIIIGSAIRGDNIHESVKAFIDSNRSALNQKKIAVFAACITITSSKERKREHARTYPDKVACGLRPIRTAVFAGNAPSSGWLVDKIGKMILGITPGDYRDWNRIKEWAGSLTEL